MTFRSFAKWCKARKADNYWNYLVAERCCAVCEDVLRQKWWRREKYFRTTYDVNEMEGYVVTVNAIINYDRKVKKGMYE